MVYGQRFLFYFWFLPKGFSLLFLISFGHCFGWNSHDFQPKILIIFSSIIISLVTIGFGGSIFKQIIYKRRLNVMIISLNKSDSWYLPYSSFICKLNCWINSFLFQRKRKRFLQQRLLFVIKFIAIVSMSMEGRVMKVNMVWWK